MAGGASALADEDLQASLRRGRIAGHGHPVAPLERIAEFVERRAARRYGLLEGCQGLGHIDQHGIGRVRRERRAEQSCVGRGDGCIGGQPLAYQLGRRPELLLVEHRADALRPEAVGSPGPAEPAVEPEVGERDGVAVDAGEPDAAVAAVGKEAGRIVAGRARAPAVAGEARVREQLLAERNGGGVAGDTVARVERSRLRPGPMRQDGRSLHLAELYRRLGFRRQRRAAGDRQRGKGSDSGERPHGPSVTSCVRRVRVSPWTRSNVSRHVPAMCSISPVTRNRPGPVGVAVGR